MHHKDSSLKNRVDWKTYVGVLAFWLYWYVQKTQSGEIKFKNCKPELFEMK